MTLKFTGLRSASLIVCACVFSTAFAQEAEQDQSFTLSWSAPTQNEDGSPLIEPAFCFEGLDTGEMTSNVHGFRPFDGLQKMSCSALTSAVTRLSAMR